MNLESGWSKKSSVAHYRRNRVGLTILEFLACAIAVLGGAFLARSIWESISATSRTPR